MIKQKFFEMFLQQKDKLCGICSINDGFVNKPNVSYKNIFYYSTLHQYGKQRVYYHLGLQVCVGFNFIALVKFRTHISKTVWDYFITEYEKVRIYISV